MNLQRQYDHQARPAAARGPFFIVLNAGSGSDDAQAVRETIEHAFLDAGRQHTLLLVDQPGKLAEQARRAVYQARATNGVVVAAGGDGTINTVAQAALEHGLPFGVIPQGTFNYFSRTHGIPSDVEEAVQVLLQAPPQPVQVGLVNDHVFLVNASLGLYPRSCWRTARPTSSSSAAAGWWRCSRRWPPSCASTGRCASGWKATAAR
ncbi:MAG: diacylglycerol kinase family protein [Myxococcales bacterium]